MPSHEEEATAGRDSARVLKAVLFDLDGTILDSNYDWHQIRHDIGCGSLTILEYLKTLSGERHAEVMSYLEDYEDRATREATLTPGAPELLTFLKERGLATALVTNNRRSNVDSVLERFGISFDSIVTRDDGLWKPDPEPILMTLERLDTRPSECMAIGDSVLDVRAAQSAGVRWVVILDRGGSASKARSEADFRVGKLEDLETVVDQLLSAPR